jgi:hypothetical protein
MQSLSSFEELFLGFAGKGISTAQDSLATFKDLKIENPYEIIEEFVSSEILDFEAFLECIKSQQDYLDHKKRI